MYVDQTTMLISHEVCREALLRLIRSCARPKSKICYLDYRKLASDSAQNCVAIFTRPLQGIANLEIEVHWHGNTMLDDDAVAFRLSRLIEDDVISETMTKPQLDGF